MTDQEPTQVYQPPAPPEPPAAQPPVAFEPPVPPVPPVPTAPVEAAPSGGKPGRSKLKWLVAGLVTLLVAGTAAGATLLMTRDSGNAAVLAWTPADAIVYGEARLDLPGTQQAELAELMSAFPGFDDQAAFPVKFREILDRLAGEASDGKVSYSRDIEPWFNGQASFYVGALPSLQDAGSAQVGMLAGVKDATKASSWMDAMVSAEGVTTTTETYNGTTITVTDATTEMGSAKAGYAVLGPVLVAGTLDAVKAVIDTGGTKGLPTNTQFQQANASVTGDRLGFVYMDYKGLLSSLDDLASGTGMDLAPLQDVADQLPAWLAGALSAQDSALVGDVRMPHTDLSGTASATRLPGLVPAGTLLLVEGKDVGKAIAGIKDQLAKQEELQDAVKQIEDGLALLGGLDAVSGWMGEAGVVVTPVGDAISGGLVIVPTDAAAAEKLFNQLTAFLQLGGAQAGLSVSEESYNGTTITSVDLSGIAGAAGMEAFGTDLPKDLTLSFAVTDQVVVLGYGADFVKAVLDAPTAGSLASDPDFAAGLKRVGEQNTGLMWLDIAGARSLIEGLLPADAKGTYESDLKPYLDAFDYLIQAAVPGTPYDGSTVVLAVSGN